MPAGEPSDKETTSMTDPGKIRNIALVGHRGTGKTALFEALLYRGGVVNRLGKVEDGTTVSDYDDDEKRRQLSLQGTLAHVERGGLTLNLIDTPGDPELPGRHDRGAARRRDGPHHRQLRARCRGADRASLGSRRRAGAGEALLLQHARPRARRPGRYGRGAARGLRPAGGAGAAAHRRRARVQGSRRPPHDEGAHARRSEGPSSAMSRPSSPTRRPRLARRSSRRSPRPATSCSRSSSPTRRSAKPSSRWP